MRVLVGALPSLHPVPHPTPQVFHAQQAGYLAVIVHNVGSDKLLSMAWEDGECGGRGGAGPAPVGPGGQMSVLSGAPA